VCLCVCVCVLSILLRCIFYLLLGKESSEGSILVEQQDIDSHKQPSRGALKTRSNLEPVQEVQELHDDGFDLKDETSWV